MKINLLKNQSAFCRFCFFACLLLIGYTCIVGGFRKKAPDPVRMAALADDTIQFEHIRELTVLYGSKTSVPKTPRQAIVHKGDSLTVLAVVMPVNGKEARFWVEKNDGTRGLIYMDVLERTAVVTGKKKGYPLEKGDSVEILSSQRSPYFDSKAKVRRLSDRQVFENVDEELLASPAVIRLYKQALTLDAYTLITLADFENGYLGKTLQQTDSLGIPALSVADYRDTLRAVYSLKVFDPAEGRFFRPTVQFGKDGLSTGYSRYYYDGHCNAWLLRHMPAAAWVYRIPWMTRVLDEPLFQRSYLNKGSISAAGFWNILLTFAVLAIAGLLFLIWLVGWALTVPLILMGMAGWPGAYKFLSNRVLLWTIVVLSLVWLYVCTALMLSYIWWFLYIPVSLYALWWIINHFITEVLIFRCNKCKHLYTINEVACDVVDEYDSDWIPESRRSDLIGKQSRRWDTWDNVTRTTKTYQGNNLINTESTTTKENVKHHTETQRTYRYHDFLVKYHICVYQHTDQCSHCGNLTYRITKDSQKIDEQYAGTHTETHTSYDVR